MATTPHFLPPDPLRIAAGLLLAASCWTGAPVLAAGGPEGASKGLAVPDAGVLYDDVLDTVVVTATRPARPPGAPAAPLGAIRLGAERLADWPARSSDTARLLTDLPGVDAYGAGALSSLPVIHGLADDRLRTQVDGMDLMSACPNHMNPALSYIDPAKVANVEVYAGVAPVSMGGDSIGGAIRVHSAPFPFAGEDEGLRTTGNVGGFYRSNGAGRGYHAGLSLAGTRFGLAYDQSLSESDNYRAGGNFKLPGLWKALGERYVPDDEVAVSEYGGAFNRELSLAVKPAAGHVVRLTFAEQRLDYEGFPNQRMDMVASFPLPVTNNYRLDKDATANRNRSVNFHYQGGYDWGALEARLYHQDVRHHMDMLQDRFWGMYMPMDTEASTLGGLLRIDLALSGRDTLRLGSDFQNYRLDDWWPPIGVAGAMCCDDFWNIRDGKRERIGLFAEWETRWSPSWQSLVGLRGDRVESNTGEVQGYNATYAADAAAFNALDRRRVDHHLDLTALVRHTPDPQHTYELGFARKTRSPNLYERYPWSTNSMAWVMNNFVGDGNGYLGNPDLNPETAYTLKLSTDWHAPDGEQWRVSMTGHVSHVRDYITAERCKASVSPLCNAVNSTTRNRFVLLQYVNHDARLAGIDLSAELRLGGSEGVGRFSLTGTLSYLHGKDLDSDEPLYHIMPLNGKLGLTHRLGGWTGTAEWVLVDGKDDVSRVRNEVRTSGYGLLNLRGGYQWKQVRLDLAIENAFDRLYFSPLGGAYLGQGNSMTVNSIPWGMAVPGPGRSVNVALDVRF